MKFTNPEFDQFRKALKLSVESMEKLFDVTIDSGRIKYNTTSFEVVLKVKMNDIDGKSSDQVEFEKQCRYYGLKPEDYGHSVTLNDGTPATVAAIFPRRRKYPIGVTTSNGKMFLMTQLSVQRQIARGA